MTCYLTDGADPVELANGKQQGVWVAAKLYPAHATTNSAHGVTSMDKIARGLEAMEKAGMPLLVHGEVTDRRRRHLRPRGGVPGQGAGAAAAAASGAEGRAGAHHDQGGRGVRRGQRRAHGRHDHAASLRATTATPSSRAASVRISIACRSPRARSTGWRCAARRPRAARNSSSAPTPRRTPPTPRNAPAAAPASSTRRWRCRSTPRSSPRRARSTGWRPSPR